MVAATASIGLVMEPLIAFLIMIYFVFVIMRILASVTIYPGNFFLF